ncbi:hypothetical protein ILUMI_07648 [Ignelater luminosus]|uniref:DDE Tnp4 domain-containing protein n=1 Tax=Ignelater luminosus TaxID=2038154 RepID=A0A8K0G5R7_IGNLU|nr:hypothetical protein ILUMI_16661 [Ignelater luminosus]KAF2898528.1 hypothetical protein ILUMI_07648 [Ignelater luminosus]
MEDLLALAVLDGKIDNFEEAILHELIVPQPKRFLRATKYTRLNINYLTEEKCRANFRFQRNDLQRLCDALGIPPHIQTDSRCSTAGVEEPLFGLSAEYISIIANAVMNIIVENKAHLLTNLNNLNCLNRNRMRYYADQLQQCAVFEDDDQYVLYGDPAYPLTDLLLCPYAGRNLTKQQQNFNRSMSTVRKSVEWEFGKVISELAFLDYKKNQKLLLQDIGNMYRTAVILTNCHTRLYDSQSNQYFNIKPPTLEEYLGV